MLFFNTWGLLNTFGVYQTYYESGQLWTASSSDISWIGSIQALMVLLGGSLSGPLFDRGYLRSLLVTGTFGIVFGHMMLSLTHKYWETLLAQGFVIGLGASCLFIPAVAILPTYFSSKIGLALGLAASGSSMGGIIYPIMFYKLIDQVGFGWSVRILGFTTLATLLLPIFVMKIRVRPPKPRSVVDWTAFTDFPYMLFVAGTVVGFAGLYVGLFYTSYYGEATRYTDTSLSFYLVPILNAGSVFGRTLPNWLSDKIGPFNVIAPGALCVGIVTLCYNAVSNAGGLVVLALLFGFFSGIFIAMPPVLFVALTKDKSKIGTRIGMGFAMLGIGVLAGGPGGGGILGSNEHDLHFTGVWIYAGVTFIAASAVFFALRIMRGGWKLRVKV
ncbi:major facilitator superfamily domain-containing protein [Neohortaea acidophila]|uniref:Major facilitator superfamily domain-containing protein n=1 Tax=Neohortaea acidophila TaxID=245834 RepID=A0A6A6Q2J6_9PEZI|nr:major facilitator superfamily domain-containing protein [Neohortaea acidophila]KAF2486748.1 major facilitator superfamily domain-containing protein [Neohortaea acidophila]